jgi:hypothetical protein
MHECAQKGGSTADRTPLVIATCVPSSDIQQWNLQYGGPDLEVGNGYRSQGGTPRVSYTF